MLKAEPQNMQLFKDMRLASYEKTATAIAGQRHLGQGSGHFMILCAAKLIVKLRKRATSHGEVGHLQMHRSPSRLACRANHGIALEAGVLRVTGGRPEMSKGIVFPL